MQPRTESSVLFALDELREIEARRSEEAREAERQRQDSLQAERAARSAQRAALANEQAAQATKLEALRRQSEAAIQSRGMLEADLEASLHERRVLQVKLDLLEKNPPESAPAAPSKVSQQIHVLWTGALIAACAGVYLLAHGGGQGQGKVPDLRAMVRAEPPPERVCAEQQEADPLALAPAPALVAEAAPVAETTVAKQTRRRHKRGAGTEAETGATSGAVTIDACTGKSQGPLCDLPD